MEQSHIQLDRKHFWALCLTLFMIAYNLAVMQPIMPLVVRTFDSSMGYVQVALVLFSLVAASFAPTTENLCRFYGREQVFITGLVCYGIGITMTALSADISVLVVSFAILAGLAATPLVSAPWVLMDAAYDGKAEQKATLAFILSSTFGGLSGAILGGLIASRIGWRWAFLPSIAVFLLVLLLGQSLPRTPVKLIREPIDWVGGLLSLLGLGSILLGISLSGEFGWWLPKRLFSIAGIVIPPFPLSIVPLLIAVGTVSMGLFLFWQRRQARRGASLLRVGLLRKQAFVCGMLAGMLHTMVTTGVQFNLYQLLPTLLNLNPFQTAIAVLPYNLTLLIVLIALLKYLSIEQKIAPKVVVYIGVGLLAIGLIELHSVMNAELTGLKLLPGLVTMGVGSALFLAYIASLTFSVASQDEIPESRGIYNPVQNLGSSLGRGILGTALIFFTSQGIVNGVLATLGKELSQPERRQAIATLQRMIQTYATEEVRSTFAKLPAVVQPELKTIIHTSALQGTRITLLVALVLAVLCLLLATPLPGHLRRSNKEVEPTS
ncbi:MFS transporter [Leptolyngbya ohadii]|uniref:MFS transporter n=1 Tax=Leptolyngbya ohadii TaxID=1962290 RepID=UPI000B59FBE5|nr:MFS transporter [Leptolyngbya ohadii]